MLHILHLRDALDFQLSVSLYLYLYGHFVFNILHKQILNLKCLYVLINIYSNSNRLSKI